MLLACSIDPDVSPFDGPTHATQRSVCWFELDLEPGFERPEAAYAGMLRAVAAQRARLSSRVVATVSIPLVRDAAGVGSALAEETRRRLVELGVPDGTLFLRTVPWSERRRNIGISVCDHRMFEDARVLGRGNVDRPVRASVGGHDLTFPAGYLPAGFWLDLPFRDIVGDGLPLRVSWPDLGHAGQHAVTPCQEGETRTCPLLLEVNIRRGTGTPDTLPPSYVVERREGSRHAMFCVFHRRHPYEAGSAPVPLTNSGVCTITGGWLGADRIWMPLPEILYGQRWKVLEDVASAVRRFRTG